MITAVNADAKRRETGGEGFHCMVRGLRPPSNLRVRMHDLGNGTYVNTSSVLNASTVCESQCSTASSSLADSLGDAGSGESQPLPQTLRNAKGRAATRPPAPRRRRPPSPH